MKKNKKLTAIEQLRAYIARFEMAIQSLDDLPFNLNSFEMPEKKSELGSELNRRGAYVHFKNLITAFDKRDKRKCEHHIEKVRRCLRVTANDDPHYVGKVVDVIRTERGFEPGYTARITAVFGSGNGTYSYQARVIEDESGVLKEADQFNIDITHTRDAR